MSNIRYQISLALSPKDYELLTKLQAKKVKQIDIFRKGLEVITKETK